MFTLVIISCAKTTINLTILENKTNHNSVNQIHWEYKGKLGVEHWGELSKEFTLCSGGKNQSPVNINSHNVINQEDLEFYYQPSDIDIPN